MGKDPMKENKNVYFQARKKAAEWDERLFSREGAAELLGIASYTLGDYELGNVKRVPPEKVLLMADLYKAPELLTNYCRNECPIQGFMPLATEEKNIQGVALRILKGLRADDLEVMKSQLVDISEDGIISDAEIGILESIMEHLESLAEAISELKIVSEKCLSRRRKEKKCGR